MSVLYHPDKANMVVDARSRLYMGRITHVEERKIQLAKKMASYEALYGRRCRSAIGWFEVGKAELIVPDLVHQSMEKVKIIQQRVKTAKSLYKSYAVIKKRDLEFEVNDWIVKRVGNIAYELELLLELDVVHPVFHISILKKCLGDRSLILPTKSIGVKESLSYEEIPIQILDRQVRKLRTKEVASVKVL
ncbi:uncharacterized protein LOC129894585 [Solanum dulcamara]|uniref:uncharacterized protein LOC129894585 n=1 Tax=Solanum dulcamara TaxID=45834 RepID=UPI002486B989|nr:uncharacterized protein LOC129894585 [Solanum dulcamara]